MNDPRVLKGLIEAVMSILEINDTPTLQLEHAARVTAAVCKAYWHHHGVSQDYAELVLVAVILEMRKRREGDTE